MSTRTLKPAQQIPPLETGDHLSRAEFERRSCSTPGIKKAELIEGQVYMSPPVSHENHGAPHFLLIGWMAFYAAATPGVMGGDNGSLRLDLENMPQPDAYLMIDPACGGQAKIDDDGYVQGAPELVAEIAATSASIDLHEKMQVYRRSGVREYLVWRVFDGALDWFILREGEYQRLAPAEGALRSEVFPGLWLDAAALLAGDLAKVLQVVQHAFSTPQHQTFLRDLRRRGDAASR